jgi:hypothetical protein
MGETRSAPVVRKKKMVKKGATLRGALVDLLE